MLTRRQAVGGLALALAAVGAGGLAGCGQAALIARATAAAPTATTARWDGPRHEGVPIPREALPVQPNGNPSGLFTFLAADADVVRVIRFYLTVLPAEGYRPFSMYQGHWFFAKDDGSGVDVNPIFPRDGGFALEAKRVRAGTMVAGSLAADLAPAPERALTYRDLQLPAASVPDAVNAQAATSGQASYAVLDYRTPATIQKWFATTWEGPNLAMWTAGQDGGSLYCRFRGKNGARGIDVSVTTRYGLTAYTLF